MLVQNLNSTSNRHLDVSTLAGNGTQYRLYAPCNSVIITILCFVGKNHFLLMKKNVYYTSLVFQLNPTPGENYNSWIWKQWYSIQLFMESNFWCKFYGFGWSVIRKKRSVTNIFYDQLMATLARIACHIVY